MDCIVTNYDSIPDMFTGYKTILNPIICRSVYKHAAYIKDATAPHILIQSQPYTKTSFPNLTITLAFNSVLEHITTILNIATVVICYYCISEYIVTIGTYYLVYCGTRTKDA